jgi:dolichol-phosphate mannosyltransferase
LSRKLTSRVANFLAHIVLSPPCSDLTGSYRLYKRSVLESLLSQFTPSGYVFQMEIITRASYSGYSISEVPITFVDRVYGESKMGKNEILQYIKALGRLFLQV